MHIESMLKKIKIWIRATRAPSFTASLVPILVTVALSLYYRSKPDWRLLPLIVTCSILFHAGTNLINDYFDFEKGLDKNNSFGSNHVLNDAILKPKQILIAGRISFVIGFLLGLILVYFRGLPMIILGLIGLAGGYCYTARPIAYKYIGLGDLFVFLLMGPLMVMGAYFALTGIYDKRVLFVSFPVGFLVTAILNSNNIRDITYDKEINIKTFAGLIGEKNAKLEYLALIVSSYLSIILMVIANILPPTSLSVFLSLPLALRNITKIIQSNKDTPRMLAFIDVETAQLQLLFALLLSSATIFGIFL